MIKELKSETKISNGNLISRSELLKIWDKEKTETENLMIIPHYLQLEEMINTMPTVIGRSAEDIAGNLACYEWLWSFRNDEVLNIDTLKKKWLEWLEGSADNE